jgi:hypothetical protein
VEQRTSHDSQSFLHFETEPTSTRSRSSHGTRQSESFPRILCFVSSDLGPDPFFVVCFWLWT